MTSTAYTTIDGIDYTITYTEQGNRTSAVITAPRMRPVRLAARPTEQIEDRVTSSLRQLAEARRHRNVVRSSGGAWIR